MTFQATILECLQRLQKEILKRGTELSAEELWCVFNGEAIDSSRRVAEGTEVKEVREVKEVKEERARPKKKIFKKKKKPIIEDLEPEVETWRQGRYGKLYLKCIKTGRLYDPNTEKLVGLYKLNPDTELETITLYDS